MMKSLVETLSDYLLLDEAQRRVDANDGSENLSHEELMRDLGITPEELSEIDVELEVDE